MERGDILKRWRNFIERGRNFVEEEEKFFIGGRN